MNNNDESPYVRRYFACGVSNDYTRAGDRFSESEDIRADYVNAGPEHGHYFDPDTLAFFGSKHFRTYGRGMSIEYQANAPHGVGRYRVQAWRVSDDGAPEPWYGHTHKTKDQAQKCAFVTRHMILSNGATTDRAR